MSKLVVQLNGMDVDVTQWMDKHPGKCKVMW